MDFIMEGGASVTRSNDLHMKMYILKKDNQTCVVVAATTDAAIARVKQRTGDIYAVTGVAKLNEVLLNP